jgi:hypothetical protein
MKNCETCKFRSNDGYCQNKKLAEDGSQSNEERQDMLLYDYSEGGGFWVGPKFGCVHHSDR